MPDDADRIAEAIQRWCDGGTCDLLLTNGGTGLAPRDVTPEATRRALDVEAPGLGESTRAAGLAAPRWQRSRARLPGVASTRWW